MTVFAIVQWDTLDDVLNDLLLPGGWLRARGGVRMTRLSAIFEVCGVIKFSVYLPLGINRFWYQQIPCVISQVEGQDESDVVVVVRGTNGNGVME